MYKKFTLVLVLFLAVFSIPAQNQYSTCYTYNIKAGDEAFDQERYEDAKRFYVNASKCANPNTQEAQKKIKECDFFLKLTAMLDCDRKGVTDYDGNTYVTIQIGNQCWMAQNLRTKHYANGNPIPQNTDRTFSSTDAYYYDFKGKLEGDKYISFINGFGFLYNWPAVMRGASSSSSNPSNIQGICPYGWHLPSDAEWRELINYLGRNSSYVCGNKSSNVAKALSFDRFWKESSTDCAIGNDLSNNNSSYFSAVPIGSFVEGKYRSGAYLTAFWTTNSEGDKAYVRMLHHDSGEVTSKTFPKNRGFSVRCVRN